MAKAALALSVVAVVLGALAVLAAETSAPRGPLGVCVAYDVNTVGTYVDSPKRINGVLSCEVGTFVPVTPR